jgi:hypothetical protein
VLAGALLVNHTIGLNHTVYPRSAKTLMTQRSPPRWAKGQVFLWNGCVVSQPFPDQSLCWVPRTSLRSPPVGSKSFFYWAKSQCKSVSSVTQGTLIVRGRDARFWNQVCLVFDSSVLLSGSGRSSASSSLGRAGVQPAAVVRARVAVLTELWAAPFLGINTALGGSLLVCLRLCPGLTSWEAPHGPSDEGPALR